MELNLSEIRIIIDALKFKSAHLEQEQAKLDDSEEDKIAELSNDIYCLEILTDCLTDDCNKRIGKIKDNCLEHCNKIKHPVSKVGVDLFHLSEPQIHTD
ncbi:MAG: hypothetical protein GY795_01445 [Desulfobacterales bacterium]|nr:hypothetical protein [Desulfobacterales bacterium]